MNTTTEMNIDNAFNVFRDLMRMLMSKSKKELFDETMKLETPEFIKDIIMTHPALLGSDDEDDVYEIK